MNHPDQPPQSAQDVSTSRPAVQKAWRLWPGITAAVLLGAARFIIPWVNPDAAVVGVLGGLIGAAVILVWWLFFSRAPWWERLGAVGLMTVALWATSRGVHPSLANGMMGYLLPIYAIPVLGLALVAWAVASHRLRVGLRRTLLMVAIACGCGAFLLLRTGGITGSAASDFHWRWSPTPEDRLLAQAVNEPPARPASSTAAEIPAAKAANPVRDEPGRPATGPRNIQAAAAWPGFRGPERNGTVHGVRIATDWVGTPPIPLWRRPVGPGWSSFAIHGNQLYTQEQRGSDEIVACYQVSTGEPLWRHQDAARFWESNAGPGPRGTPTLGHGRVYTLGATGILNALDATNGASVWSRQPATDTGRKVPEWGFASSPLLVDEVVIVATAGTLVAYDAATGDRRWLGPSGGGGYSSPQLITLDGVGQVLLMSGIGITSVAPADGALLWQHRWPNDGIVQPSVTADGDILIGSGSGIGGASIGIRRLGVEHGTGGWTVKERWTSTGLKPYFNDFVAYQGHAFGFDGGLLACIDLADGKRNWKDGRYGNGQLILLSDQGLLLVLSERGELGLVRATADQFTQFGRFSAIKGKTWNHPALAGDILLVRNEEEMAAFRLALANR